jgi:hypothetical protein
MYQMGSSDYVPPRGETSVVDSTITTSLNYFLVAPRLGYGAMFGKRIGIWGRVGATDVSGSAEHTEAWPETQTSEAFEQEPVEFKVGATYLNVDVMLLLALAPSFGFTLGPTYDHALRYKQDGNDQSSYRAMGVQAGVMGWF